MERSDKTTTNGFKIWLAQWSPDTQIKGKVGTVYENAEKEKQ